MKQFSKELGKVSITPKGAWNSNITNDRLDVVYDRRNNQAYIAKQDVPIGVDIDNREYWQPLNVSGYADNNFINLCRVNSNGNLIAYDDLQEAISSVESIGRKPGAVLSFYNINKDRKDNNYQFDGKNALVIGRSNIVGKPMFNMLLNLNTRQHQQNTYS